jgi:cold shock CspA family protein
MTNQNKETNPATTTSVEKLAGRITSWTKNYGFIEVLDGTASRSVFVHISGFIGIPPENIRDSFVEFTMGEFLGRPCAKNVVVVRGAK